MLDKRCVIEIQKECTRIKKELGIEEEIIGEEIFEYLRKRSKIIFFPLAEEPDLDGFHTKRIVNGKLVEFIFINTSKNIEKCIFCAAHELGHLFQIEKEVKKNYDDIELSQETIDEIMNRFAAELLMPTQLFRSELNKKLANNSDWSTKKQINLYNLLEIVIYLMDKFYVPYKAVVYRMNEVGFLTSDAIEILEYINKEKSEIINSIIYKGKYVRLHNPYNIKSFEDLPELLKRADIDGSINLSLRDYIKREFEINNVASDEDIDEITMSILDTNKINKAFDSGE